MITVLLIWAVATIVFLFMRIIPGDPAALIAGDTATDEQLLAIRTQLGLEEPMLNQYGSWMFAMIQGDLGDSIISNRPVVSDLANQLPRTLELAFSSVVLATIVGLPIGIWAATHRNRMQDHVSSAVALVGLSVPGFIVGSVLMLLLAVKWQVLPATGFVPLMDDPVQHYRHMLLPAVSLAAPMAAVIVRYTRSAVLDVLNKEYVRTAHAKGLGPAIVLYKHAVRNALIPVITVIGLEMGALLGGTVIIETIFSWPGLSSMLFRAIAQRDYPVVQGVVLLIAVVFILLNLLVDIVNALLDPRIRY